jgi:hypothetical protein
MIILTQYRTTARVAAIWLLVLCLAAVAVMPAPAFAEGDKVQGDKGQGEVSRWAWLEEPWAWVILGAGAIGVLATFVILFARRRR